MDTYRPFQRSWDPLEVQSTASGGGFEVPLLGADGSDAEADLSQRHATPGELTEMAGHARRLGRRALATFFGTAYFAAICLRFVEMLLEGGMKTTLSPLGWGFAALIGGGFALDSIRTRSKLRRAMEVGKVAIIRPQEQAEDAPARLEMLLGTDLIWSVEDAPAPWRTVKW